MIRNKPKFLGSNSVKLAEESKYVSKIKKVETDIPLVTAPIKEEEVKTKPSLVDRIRQSKKEIQINDAEIQTKEPEVTVVEKKKRGRKPSMSSTVETVTRTVTTTTNTQTDESSFYSVGNTANNKVLRYNKEVDPEGNRVFLDVTSTIKENVPKKKNYYM